MLIDVRKRTFYQQSRHTSEDIRKHNHAQSNHDALKMSEIHCCLRGFQEHQQNDLMNQIH